MSNPIDHPRIRGLEKQKKAPPWLNEAQIGNVQSAPQIFSTPFPKNRYQIIATFWERCHFFCKKSHGFYLKTHFCVKIYVLYKIITAFAPYIRGPPKLNLVLLNSNDWR